MRSMKCSFFRRKSAYFKLELVIPKISLIDNFRKMIQFEIHIRIQLEFLKNKLHMQSYGAYFQNICSGFNLNAYLAYTFFAFCRFACGAQERTSRTPQTTTQPRKQTCTSMVCVMTSSTICVSSVIVGLAMAP